MPDSADIPRLGFETALKMLDDGNLDLMQTMALWRPEAFEQMAKAFGADGQLDNEWLEQANITCRMLGLGVQLRRCPDDEIPVRWVDDPTVWVLQATSSGRYDSTARFAIHPDGRIEPVQVSAFFM